MRVTMERYSILPFSIGCVSHSSVDVVENPPRKSQGESITSTPSGEAEERLSSKANIGEKLQKLKKSFKSLPQMMMLQTYKEDQGEEEEVEMEIGFPTDVRHVGHIGWDASRNNPLICNLNGWERATDRSCLSLLSP